MPAYPIFIVKPGANGTCRISFDAGEGGSVYVKDSTGYDDMIYEIDMETCVALMYREGGSAAYGTNAASSISGRIKIPPGEHVWRMFSNGSPQVWVKPMWWRI
jgi:hypothetical protein